MNAPPPDRRRAFGLDLEGDVSVPGTEVPADEVRDGPPLRMGREPRSALLQAWPRDGAVRISDRRPYSTVDHHPHAGLLLRARGWGTYLLDAAATTARCAPVRQAEWRWQRYLVAQVLPFAALLRGREVFHAAAVEVGERAVAITGPSRAGKSTLTAELLARGHRLVADDVAAIDPELTVHPGPGLLTLRADVASAVDVERLGAVLGANADEVRIAVPRRATALPLGALAVLQRTGAGSRPRVTRVQAPDPRVLLASTFNLAWQEPRRLTRQLDVCARLARSVPVFDVRIPSGATPRATAAAIERAVST